MFLWPVPSYYAISSGYYDQRDYGLHGGIDIPAPAVPCVAISAGKVIFANWAGSAGRSVYLDMGTFRVHYCHLSRIDVTVGKHVALGEIIGLVGGSGHGVDDYYGSHLHLNLFAAIQPATGPSHWVAWVGMWAVDPELYLSKEDDDMALTDEQNAMLQTIHHMEKLVAPQERAYLAKCLRALEAADNARFEVLRKWLIAIGASGDGDTAEEMADELARRLLE